MKITQLFKLQRSIFSFSTATQSQHSNQATVGECLYPFCVFITTVDTSDSVYVLDQDLQLNLYRIKIYFTCRST